MSTMLVEVFVPWGSLGMNEEWRVKNRVHFRFMSGPLDPQSCPQRTGRQRVRRQSVNNEIMG